MPDTSNGRVTLAVLSTKLDTVIAKLDQMEHRADLDHDRLGVVEGRTNGHTRRIVDLEKKSVARAWEGRVIDMIIAGLVALGILQR